MPRRIRRRRSENLRRPRGGTGFSPTFPFTVTSLSPNTAAQGAADTPVNVNGEDFQAGATVYVDGVSQTTGFSTALLLTFTMPAAILAVPGYKVVQVKRTTFSSNTRLFAVLFPVPTLSAATFASPNLNVTGTGFFASGTHARIDGNVEAAFTYLSPTTGTVAVPDAILNEPGSHTVVIYNDAPGGGTSASRSFQVKYNASVLASMGPVTQQFAGRNSGTLTIVADPSGPFYLESVVHVDGTLCSSMQIDPLTIQVNIPGALLPAGTHNVTVFNPTTGGGGGESNALVFTAVVPVLQTLSITETIQYFDGFDNLVILNNIDSSFEVTANGVAQPTTYIDSHTLLAHVTTAACSVAGTTMVRARDTISGVSTNSIAFQVTAWDPTAVGADLRLFLDGTSAVDDGTGRAQALNDKSGGARHLTQATAGKRPLIVASVPQLNNQPALFFDGTRQDVLTNQPWVIQPATPAAGVITKTDYNIWVVAAANANAQIGSNATVLGEPGPWLWAGNMGTGISVDDNSIIVNCPFSWPTGIVTPFAVRSRKTGGSLYGRVNRGAELSAAVSATYSPTDILLGQGRSGTWYFTGYVALVLVARADLNATYKAIIDNMISAKYGLPYGEAGSAPTVDHTVPNTAQQYDLPFEFDVFNTDGRFTAKSVVNVGALPLATQLLSAYQLRATMPASAVFAYGGKAITVADTGGISGPIGFAVTPYTPGPGATATRITPEVKEQYRNGFTIDVDGLNFTSSSQIFIGATAIATTQDGTTPTTRLHGTVPASVMFAAAALDVVVHDPAGNSNPLRFTVTPRTPSDIPGLTARYRADTVVLNGSTVSQWTDLGPNGFHLVQATATKQPLLIASDPLFNNRPVLSFDGVDDTLVATVQASGNHITNAAWGVFAAYKMEALTTAANPSQPYGGNTIFGVDNGAFFGVACKNTPEAWGYKDGANQYCVNSGLVLNAAQQLVFTRATNFTMALYINGTKGPDYVGATNPTMSSQKFSVGSLVTGFYAKMRCPEVLTMKTTPTADDIELCNNYYTHWYGIPHS